MPTSPNADVHRLGSLHDGSARRLVRPPSRCARCVDSGALAFNRSACACAIVATSGACSWFRHLARRRARQLPARQAAGQSGMGRMARAHRLLARCGGQLIRPELLGANDRLRRNHSPDFERGGRRPPSFAEQHPWYSTSGDRDGTFYSWGCWRARSQIAREDFGRCRPIGRSLLRQVPLNEATPGLCAACQAANICIVPVGSGFDVVKVLD